MEMETSSLRLRISGAIARLGALAMFAPAAALAGCGGNDPGIAEQSVVESQTERLSLSTDCDAIATQLQAARALAAELLQEFQDAPPGPEKSRLLNLWKAAQARVSQLQAQLDRCLHPPAPLPNLIAQLAVIRYHDDPTVIDAALDFQNIGRADVTTPFNIVFGATAGNVFRQITYRITYPIPAVSAFVTPYMTNIQGIPDSRGTIVFRIDAIVDSDNEIAEEGVDRDNTLTQTIENQLPPPPPPPPPPCNGICCDFNPDGSCATCISSNQECP